nr:MAG TPA: hypothetical protein [Caudoviricetes sp.]
MAERNGDYVKSRFEYARSSESRCDGNKKYCRTHLLK